MIKNIVALLFAIVIFSACDPEKREQKLQEEVISIHDEAMPLMDQIMRQKGRLQYKIDSLNATGEPHDKEIEALREGIITLRRADSAMMTWMRQFKAVRDTVTHEERIEYLEEEKEKIGKVHHMMLEAIEEAEKGF